MESTTAWRGWTKYRLREMFAVGSAIIPTCVQRMARYITCGAIITLTGCASMSAPQMSAEQLKAAATDKNFSAICLTFTGVGGSGKSVVVNVDQRVVINGSISVSPDCVVTMSNMATVKPEPAAK